MYADGVGGGGGEKSNRSAIENRGRKRKGTEKGEKDPLSVPEAGNEEEEGGKLMDDVQLNIFPKIVCKTEIPSRNLFPTALRPPPPHIMYSRMRVD